MAKKSDKKKSSYKNKFFKILGPGLITGVSNNDPSGIATNSQTGAQFGYGQLWTAFFMLPMMIAIQEACARIGAVKGQGISAIIKEHYNQKILYSVILLILIANIINIGADIQIMAVAIQLIVPLNFIFLIFLIAFLILIQQIFISYKKFAYILKWFCLFFLLYPLTLFIIKAPLIPLLKATFIPNIQLNFEFLFILMALFGTTISPYMFFWQASQEVEEKHEKGRLKISNSFMQRIRLDNFIGMLVSQICSWSIIAVTAIVLNQNGITYIHTAAQAAKSLEPFAGQLAKIFFTLGIIGLGFLSVPVLSGSASYAVCEALSWHKGLNLKLKSGYGFYGVICVATLLGLAMSLLNVNPVKALIYSSAINGIVSIPLIFLIARIADNKKIMGSFKSGFLSNMFIWITFFGMLASALAMFLTFYKK